MIEIEKEKIPIPRHSCKPRKYPFAEMKIGGNPFFIKCPLNKRAEIAKVVRGAAGKWQSRHLDEGRYAVYVVDKGVRCWKVKRSIT